MDFQDLKVKLAYQAYQDQMAHPDLMVHLVFQEIVVYQVYQVKRVTQVMLLLDQKVNLA
jgi:hypothetical protein